MAGVIQSYALNLGLNEVPDDSIDPEVWRELQNIFQALKNLADSMDSGSHPGIAGTPGSQVKIQNYAVMYRLAGEYIPAGSTVMFDQGVARLTNSTYPFADGFAEDAIAAGATGKFIMFGMVYYPPGGLSIGAGYYLTSSSGVISTSGIRFIGQAFSANTLFFDPQRF